MVVNQTFERGAWFSGTKGQTWETFSGFVTKKATIASCRLFLKKIYLFFFFLSSFCCEELLIVHQN
jgi:hypothetical protein